MDIPAHVVNPNVVENHVMVQGGTNWDLSRGAVETPVYPLSDTTPVKTQPGAGGKISSDASGLFMRIHFANGSARAPKDLAHYLAMLPKGAVIALRSPAPVTVVKNNCGCRTRTKVNSALAAQRKNVVRAALEHAGFTVVPDGSVRLDAELTKKSYNSVEVFLVK